MSPGRAEADGPPRDVELLPFGGWQVTPAAAATVVALPPDHPPLASERRPSTHDAPRFSDALPPPDLVGDALRAELPTYRAVLDRMLAEGRLQPLPGPSLAVVTVGRRDRPPLRAVVGDLPVTAYLDGRVLGHERVDPTRVAALADYQEAMGVATSSVCVAQRPTERVGDALDAVLHRTPDVEVADPGGTPLTLHVVPAGDDRAELAAAVAAAGPAFLADGHHRAAAVVHLARRRGLGSDTPAARVLTAVVTTDDLDVLAFHRRVDGLTLSTAALPAWLRARGFEPRPVAPGPSGIPPPPAPGCATVGGPDAWWEVALPPSSDDPVEQLDVRRAEQALVGPLLAEAPERGTVRVVPVAPSAPATVVQRHGSVTVLLAQPGMEAVIAVAEARGEMPAKSTFVVPKLRGGLVVASREDRDEDASRRLGRS